MTATTDPAAILAEIEDQLRGPMAQVDQSEQEIEAAIKRHPDKTDDLYHSFRLLLPTFPVMSTEALYREHCRELLERIARGADTRPGTDAEICCGFEGASQLAPLNTTGAGVYARAFAAVFPEQHARIWADQAEHYEALRGPQIDEETALLRRKLSVADRTLKAHPPKCPGFHHSVEVVCRYAKTEEPS